MLDIDTIRSAVVSVSKKYGIAKAYLFGSYARNEAANGSDVDIRIDKGALCGLFQLSGYRLDLVDALGVEVDVLTTPSLDEEFLQRIQQEEVVLYDRAYS